MYEHTKTVINLNLFRPSALLEMAESLDVTIGECHEDMASDELADAMDQLHAIMLHLKNSDGTDFTPKSLMAVPELS